MRHPSNTSNHPVQPDRENTSGVFNALLDAIETMSDWTQQDRADWLHRWEVARGVEMARRDYDREYDRAGASIHWGR
jgi:hypothetical protein